MASHKDAAKSHERWVAEQGRAAAAALVTATAVESPFAAAQITKKAKLDDDIRTAVWKQEKERGDIREKKERNGDEEELPGFVLVQKGSLDQSIVTAVRDQSLQVRNPKLKP